MKSDLLKLRGHGAFERHIDAGHERAVPVIVLA